MSGIVGAVFIITMLNCVFGLIDRLGLWEKTKGTLRFCRKTAAQTYQAIKRHWRKA